MRGSHVHRRNKTWTIIYDQGVNEAGKRQQRTKGGFATKTEAQNELTLRARHVRRSVLTCRPPS